MKSIFMTMLKKIKKVNLNLSHLFFASLFICASTAFAGTPGAPTRVTASGNETEAYVSFEPAAANGSPITSYIVTSSDGRETVGVSNVIMVIGLNPGASYTFTVRAVNAAGVGPSSAPSAPLAMVLPPPKKIDLVIDSDTVNFNIFTAAGRPRSPANVTLTILPGVVVYSKSPIYPALTTGAGWARGSSITLINKGSIIGAGGMGGEGAWWVEGGMIWGYGFAPRFMRYATRGGKGGDAISAIWPMNIENANGFIAGGGGGGGGGSGVFYHVILTVVNGGGGGGGGAGYVPGTGGNSGHPFGPLANSTNQMFQSISIGQAAYPDLKSGGDGQRMAGGSGGWPGANPAFYNYVYNYGVGGNGGNLGLEGGWGLASSISRCPGQVGYVCPPIPGGAAGNAVVRYFGATVNWLSGYNIMTQVLGQVTPSDESPIIGGAADDFESPESGQKCVVDIDTCKINSEIPASTILNVAGVSGTFSTLINHPAIQSNSENCGALAEEFVKKNQCTSSVNAYYYNAGILEAMSVAFPRTNKNMDPGVLMTILNMILED